MRSSWKQHLMFTCPMHMTIKGMITGKGQGQSFHATIYNHMQANSRHCSDK